MAVCAAQASLMVNVGIEKLGRSGKLSIQR
jgi:hypothetical protein